MHPRVTQYGSLAQQRIRWGEPALQWLVLVVVAGVGVGVVIAPEFTAFVPAFARFEFVAQVAAVAARWIPGRSPTPCRSPAARSSPVSSTRTSCSGTRRST